MNNHPWRPFLRTFCAATLATAVLLPIVSRAQSDDFNDGETTTPVKWMEFDPIFTIFSPLGLVTEPQNIFSFPGGNAYQLQANKSPAPGKVGPARVSSFPPDIYSDFHVSADVVRWETSVSQAFGLIARAGDFATAGKPTTRGYGFVYANRGASTPQDNFIAIFRLRNDASTSGVHGSGGNVAEVHGVDLDPSKSYRFVFIGKGTHLEGRIYDLEDMSKPVAVVSANTAGEDPRQLHTSGKCGLFAFNYADENGLPFSGPVDVTYDNYVAREGDFTDSFADGNDTEPAWDHYDPLGGLTAEPATYAVADGVYTITAPAPLAPDAGPARVGAIARGLTYSDFNASVDLIDWDDTVRQAFGILARTENVGLGTTSGYLFSYELGSGALPNATGGDLDISVLTGEAPDGLKTFPTGGGIHLTKGRKYRMTFSARGADFTGQIFDLENLTAPLITLTATDPQARYTSGGVGLVVASQANPTIGARASFANFHVDGDIAPLTLSTDDVSGAAVLSWPAQLSSIWVLESSSSLEAGAVWSEIAAKDVVYRDGSKVHLQAAPIGENENTFFRLRKL